MKKFFVIGNNSSKSLSPLIFNYWFKKYKIKAKYNYVEVEKDRFDETIIKKTKQKNLCGYNVTIPYKKNILKHLHKKNTHAQKIGAVNCVKTGKKTIGINTDWIGYLNSIKTKKINKTKNILILGYGGASQAIVYGFSIKGFNNITVFNRTKKLINIGGLKKYTKKYSLINPHLTKADLIINTTPTNPLRKKQITLIKKNTLISDIVYKPMNTEFLKSLKENRKIYGISMLIEQAIPCFYFWFGFRPVVDTKLLKMLEKKIKWLK